MGPANVRARMAQVDAGSRASVSIGEISMTKGSAEEWLTWLGSIGSDRGSPCGYGGLGADGVAEVVMTCAATLACFARGDALRARCARSPD
jgi:hypothetical protein